MPQCQDPYKLFQKDENESAGMAGNLSDLNSTENLWSIEKNHWRKQDCTTKMKLIEFIIQIWLHDDEVEISAKVGIINEKTTRFGSIGIRWTYQLLIAMKIICGFFIEKRRSQELMSLLDLEDTFDRLASVSGVRWYGHVLRRNNGAVLTRVLDFKVAGRRGCG